MENIGLVHAISQLRKFKECFKVYGYCIDVLSPNSTYLVTSNDPNHITLNLNKM
jgi:hypothetical protein